MKSSKCWMFEDIDKKERSNCLNCHYWNRRKGFCNGENIIIEKYPEKKFDALDHMMRSNRGVWIE